MADASDKDQRKATFAAQLPFWRLAWNPEKGYVAMFPRKNIKKGSPLPVGQLALDVGLVVEESPDGVIDAFVVHEHNPDLPPAKTKLHVQAIRLMCGEEAVELLRAHPRISGSAWLITGGDYSNANEGLAGLLHTLTPP